MLSKVFKTQWKYPVKDDWTTSVQKDLKDLDIGLEFDEIKEMSDYSFKRLVKIKTKEYALDFLMKIKEKHSKMKKLDYVELKLQNYANIFDPQKLFIPQNFVPPNSCFLINV